MSRISKLLGSKGQKSISYTNTSVLPFNFGKVMPTISKSLAYELYAVNSDARTCVRKKGLTLSKEGFTLKNKTDMEDVEVDSAKEQYNAVKLILKDPTYQQLLIKFIKHLDVAGEVYIVPTFTLKGEVNGLQLLHPNTITKVCSGGEIVKFIQNTGGKSKTFGNALLEKSKKAGDVLLFFKLEDHVANEYDGMGLLESVIYDLLNDKESQIDTYSIFKNGMRFSHYLIPQDGVVDDQLNSLQIQLEGRHQGSENAHKPFLGFGLKDIKSLGFNQNDMGFVDLRNMSTDKVCSVLGVPKALLNYTDSTNYSNLLILRRDFIDDVMNPYQDLIENMVNMFFEKFVPSFEYYISFNDIVVQDKAEVKKLDMDEVKTGTMTLNEYREKHGREPYEFEEAYIPIVDKTRVRLDDIALDAVLPNNNT